MPPAPPVCVPPCGTHGAEPLRRPQEKRTGQPGADGGLGKGDIRCGEPDPGQCHQQPKHHKRRDGGHPVAPRQGADSAKDDADGQHDVEARS